MIAYIKQRYMIEKDLFVYFVCFVGMRYEVAIDKWILKCDLHYLCTGTPKPDLSTALLRWLVVESLLLLLLFNLSM